MTTDTLSVPATQRLTAAECRAVLLGVYAAHHEREVWACPTHGDYDPEQGHDGLRRPCSQSCREIADWQPRSTPCAEAMLDDLLIAEREMAERARRSTRRKMAWQAMQDRDDDLRALGEV